MTIKRVNRGTGHTYTIDGRPAPGVTTLIKGGWPNPGLMYWSARAVAEYVADVEADTLDALRTLGRDGMVTALKGVPWGQRDRAGVRGTAVHTLAERLMAGDQVDVPDELAGHVEACVKFLDTWRPAPVLTEVVTASRQWHYCGTLDFVADLPDGRRSIMDYKTGKGVYPEVALQLAAYRYADVYLDHDDVEQPMPPVEITCAHVVHLRADGYDVIPVVADRTVYDTFLHVATVARRADIAKSWVGEPEHLSAVAA